MKNKKASVVRDSNLELLRIFCIRIVWQQI